MLNKTDFLKLDFLEIEENSEYFDIIDKVIKKCFKEEKLDNLNIYISIILTNHENIRRINNNYRKIDKETDVLSFPMFEKIEIDEIVKKQEKFPIKEALGDIVISIERVKEQAIEYNHSFERELSYMVVHGFYHLMGYDHMEENDKKIMREKEEKILQELNIKRD